MKRRLLILIAMALPLMAMSQRVISRQEKKPVKTVKKQNITANNRSSKSANPTT